MRQYMCELQNTTSFHFFFPLIFFNYYSKKERKNSYYLEI